MLARTQRDQPHALSVAALNRDLLGAGSDQGALIADQHDLVTGMHLHGADEPPVALTGLHGDHALRGAPLQGKLVHTGTLAITVLAGGKHLAAFQRDDQRDHAVTAKQTDAAHAARGSAHRAHIAFLEAHRLAGARHQHHIGVPIRDGGPDQRVAFLELERDQSRGSRTRELLERGFLHGAVTGRHEDETVVKIVNRENGGNALFAVQGQEIDHWAPTRAAAA